MIEQAVAEEFEVFLQKHAKRRNAKGTLAVVRNGYVPGRRRSGRLCEHPAHTDVERAEVGKGILQELRHAFFSLPPAAVAGPQGGHRPAYEQYRTSCAGKPLMPIDRAWRLVVLLNQQDGTVREARCSGCGAYSIIQPHEGARRYCARRARAASMYPNGCADGLAVSVNR